VVEAVVDDGSGDVPLGAEDEEAVVVSGGFASCLLPPHAANATRIARVAEPRREAKTHARMALPAYLDVQRRAC
jgi:hypothetical protein